MKSGGDRQANDTVARATIAASRENAWRSVRLQSRADDPRPGGDLIRWTAVPRAIDVASAQPKWFALPVRALRQQKEGQNVAAEIGWSGRVEPPCARKRRDGTIRHEAAALAIGSVIDPVAPPARQPPFQPSLYCGHAAHDQRKHSE